MSGSLKPPRSARWWRDFVFIPLLVGIAGTFVAAVIKDSTWEVRLLYVGTPLLIAGMVLALLVTVEDRSEQVLFAAPIAIAAGLLYGFGWDALAVFACGGAVGLFVAAVYCNATTPDRFFRVQIVVWGVGAAAGTITVALTETASWTAVGFCDIAGGQVALLLAIVFLREDLRYRGLTPDQDAASPGTAKSDDQDRQVAQSPLEEEIRVLIAELEGYGEHEGVPWHAGQRYNQLVKEARSLRPRLAVLSIPVATEEPLLSGDSETRESPKALIGGLRLAILHLSRQEH